MTRTQPEDVARTFEALDWIQLVAVVAFVGVVTALCLLLFSAERALVLLLLPFVMAGQLVGRLPWVLVLRSPSGQRHYASVTGTRKMIEARRYYRSLRIS